MGKIVLGGPTTKHRDARTDWEFSGAAAPTLPATWYIGLAINAVVPGGEPIEVAPADGSYARQPYDRVGGNWTRDAQTGRLKTTQAITFTPVGGGATLPSAWGPDGARSLIFCTAASGGSAADGTIKHWLDVADDKQQSLAAGSPAPTFPAGQVSMI